MTNQKQIERVQIFSQNYTKLEEAINNWLIEMQAKHSNFCVVSRYVQRWVQGGGWLECIAVWILTMIFAWIMTGPIGAIIIAIAGLGIFLA